MVKKLTALFGILIVLLTVVSVLPGASAAEIPSDAITYNGNAYKCYRTALMKRTAASECKRLGGHLLIINSRDEQSYIVSHLISGDYWLGIEKNANGEWRWDDGFGAGTGNFSVIDEQYSGAVITSPGGGWSTVDVYSSHYYVCEWEGGAKALAQSGQQTGSPATATQTKIEVVSHPATVSVPTTQNAANNITITKKTAPVTTAAVTATSTAPTAPVTARFTVPTNPGETVTIGIDSLAGLDIEDTVYVYDNTFYYQVTGDNSVVISYYIGMSPDVVIPAHIDGKEVNYIAKRSFQSMSLSSAVIPPTVKTIDSSAFGNVLPSFTVYGQKGSAAQSFAKKQSFRFVEKAFDDGELNDPGLLTSADNQQTGATDKSDRILKSRIKALVGMGIIALAVIAAFVVFIIRRNRFFEAVDADRRRMDENEGYPMPLNIVNPKVEENKEESPENKNGENKEQ